MTAQELLPCPFCGGEVRLEQMVVGWRVGCPPSRCSFSGPYSANSDPVEAITAWNTRHRQVDRAERELPSVEALGEALHGLSAILLLTGALEDDQAHPAYENVVTRFATLSGEKQ